VECNKPWHDLKWANLFTSDLAVADREIAELIAAQERQNRATVNLVVSETYCPAAALAAEASEECRQLPSLRKPRKNAGGYPPRRSLSRSRNTGSPAGRPGAGTYRRQHSAPARA